MFGAANGLVTIARGAVPLALFGADGYGRLIGRIAGFCCDAGGGAAGAGLRRGTRLGCDGARLAAGFAVVALACFAEIRRPRLI